MYCPNCATKNDIQQSFCRSCGMELKDILQSLSKIEGGISDDNWLKKLGIFSIGGFVAFGICLLTIVVFPALRLGIGSALIFQMILFGLTLGLLLVNVFDKYDLKKSKKLKKYDEYFLPAEPIERWNTNKQLNESTFKPIPSITENTTDLIYAEKLKPKTSGELL